MQEQKNAPVLPKAKITVLDRSKTNVRAMYNGVIYETSVLEERPKSSSSVKAAKQTKNSDSRLVPSLDHPWRKPPTKRPPLYYEEPDSEILKMLDKLFGSTRAWA